MPTPMNRLEQLLRSPSVRAILDQDLEACALDIDQAIGLPPACYTDAEFYEFEKEVIFRKEWLCVGREAQIPNQGDWFSITIVEEPLVIVRAEPHRILALSAVCRHRARVITALEDLPPDQWTCPPAESSGNSQRFRCPYHFWVYDLEGRLRSAPEMSRTPGFETSEIALPSFRVETWNGFIFVNFDEHADPLAPRLHQFTDWIENWHLTDMELGDRGEIADLPWNWKVMHENSIESYHSDRLHRGLHESVPSGGVIATPFHDDDAVIATRIRASLRDYSLNPTYHALLPVIDTLTDEQRETSYFGVIPPTLLLGMNTDSALYRLVYPTGPQHINVKFGNLFPRGDAHSRRGREIRKMTTAGLLVMTSQDFPTDAAVQKGLRSRYAPRSRYSWQEEPLAHLNRWLVQRYRSVHSR
jgi:phenylpropionate dioxygenase-like ring-hydroxylating dioxygenase large terminal subunit